MRNSLTLGKKFWSKPYQRLQEGDEPSDLEYEKQQHALERTQRWFAGALLLIILLLIVNTFATLNLTRRPWDQFESPPT